MQKTAVFSEPQNCSVFRTVSILVQLSISPTQANTDVTAMSGINRWEGVTFSTTTM